MRLGGLLDGSHDHARMDSCAAAVEAQVSNPKAEPHDDEVRFAQFMRGESPPPAWAVELADQLDPTGVGEDSVARIIAAAVPHYPYTDPSGRRCACAMCRQLKAAGLEDGYTVGAVGGAVALPPVESDSTLQARQWAKAPPPAEDEAMRMAKEDVHDGHADDCKCDTFPPGLDACEDKMVERVADRLRPLLADKKSWRRVAEGYLAEVARFREERDQAYSDKNQAFGIAERLESERDRLLAGVREAERLLTVVLQPATADPVELVRSVRASLRALLGQEGKP